MVLMLSESWESKCGFRGALGCSPMPEHAVLGNNDPIHCSIGFPHVKAAKLLWLLI